MYKSDKLCNYGSTMRQDMRDLPRISLVPRRIGNETIVWAVMNFEPYTLSEVAGSGARKAIL